MRIKTHPTVLSLSIAAIAQLTTPALAAGAPAIEEIVVTAQKRSEKLQEVPIAITAITAEQIAARGLSSTSDLSSLSPNLQISTQSLSNTSMQVSMRGATQINNASYWDPSVGIYLDGVFIGKAMGNAFDVVDLERVEVLRGPQGTLYGRNTMAGAINFITKKPTGTFGGSVSLDVGNYGLTLLKGSVDLPKLGIASISLGYRKEDRDPTVKSPGPAQSGYDNRKNESYRLGVNFDISRDFQVDYKFDHNHTDQFGRAAFLYGANGPTYWNIAYPGFVNYVTKSPHDSQTTDSPDYERMTVNGHALTATYNIDDRNTIKALLSDRQTDWSNGGDVDGTPLPVAMGSHVVKSKESSQEFQWVGNTDRFNYTAGIFFYQEDSPTLNPQSYQLGNFSPFGPFVPINSDTSWRSQTEAQAIYGQIDWKATNALTLTAGMRSNHETKKIDRYSATNGFVSIPLTHAEKSFDSNTPMLSAAYKFSERLNVYAKYSEGFKSGGFNGEATTVAAALLPFKPEKAGTYEVGFKSQSEGGRAQLNAALFQNKVQDMQTSIFVGGAVATSQILNAGKATLTGLELEGVWVPVDGLRLQAGYGYLEAKYNKFTDPNVPYDVANNRAFIHAPKQTLNFLADATLARTRVGVLRGIVDYTFTGSHYLYPYPLVSEAAITGSTQVASNTRVESVGIWNARLSLGKIRMGEGVGEFSFWVKNVTDKRYIQNGIDFGDGFGNLTTAYWNPPRTYGTSLGYKW